MKTLFLWNLRSTICVLCLGLLLTLACGEDNNGEDQTLTRVDPLSLTLAEVSLSDLSESNKDPYGHYANDADYYATCSNIQTKVVSIPQYGTFFCYWLPDNWSSISDKHLMLLLHGSDGTAYGRIAHLYQTASNQGFGIASIQWGWAVKDGEAYQYLHDTETGLRIVYHIMTLALDYIKNAHGLTRSNSAWNGFSMGSSASVAYAWLDREGGNNYIAQFMGIAGPLHMSCDFISNIACGNYGDTILSNQNFYLWCGTADGAEGPDCTTCENMRPGALLISNRQANLVFIETEGADHMGWNQSGSLQAQAVHIWQTNMQ